jgi:hypothetical protein
MRNGINGTGLVLKILLITAHEQQTGINDNVLNNHKLYLPFIVVYYQYLLYKRDKTVLSHLYH